MIFDTIKKTGLPARYSHFTAPQEPPFIVYRGNGQDQFHADDTTIWKNNEYVVEYYFTDKDPDMEELIETTFLEDGYRYDKSDDTYIESERVFVIYYYVN